MAKSAVKIEIPLDFWRVEGASFRSELRALGISRLFDVAASGHEPWIRVPATGYFVVVVQEITRYGIPRPEHLRTQKGNAEMNTKYESWGAEIR